MMVVWLTNDIISEQPLKYLLTNVTFSNLNHVIDWPIDQSHIIVHIDVFTRKLTVRDNVSIRVSKN